MDEIIKQTPTPAVAAAKTKWRQYLETEQATRMIYLVFGFFAIAGGNAVVLNPA